jgi:hypothetical protein
MMAVSAEHDPTFWAEEVRELQEQHKALREKIRTLSEDVYRAGSDVGDIEAFYSGIALGTAMSISDELEKLHDALIRVGYARRVRMGPQ